MDTPEYAKRQCSFACPHCGIENTVLIDPVKDFSKYVVYCGFGKNGCGKLLVVKADVIISLSIATVNELKPANEKPSGV